jgi:hypothetical protein
MQAAKTIASGNDNTVVLRNAVKESSSCVIIWGTNLELDGRDSVKACKASGQTASRPRFEPSAFRTQSKGNVHSTAMFAKWVIIYPALKSVNILIHKYWLYNNTSLVSPVLACLCLHAPEDILRVSHIKYTTFPNVFIDIFHTPLSLVRAGIAQSL